VIYGHAFFTESLSPWEDPTVSATAVALDRAAVLSSPSGKAVTYARVGGKSDDGSAAFFTRPLDLACPIFAQFYFSTNLNQVVQCLVTKRPELIAVGPKFRTYGNREYLPYWNPFVTNVLALLHRDYVRVTSADGQVGVVQVWRLTDAATKSRSA
jgi:hypothetical protein